MILVIIPTLGRSRKLRALAYNIRDVTGTFTRVLYVIENEDLESYAEALALLEQGIAYFHVNDRSSSYSGAVNSGYSYAVTVKAALPFTHVFLGADDLLFSPGWDIFALRSLSADSRLRVSGTNDLHSPAVVAGDGASHFLVDRRYIDETGGVIDGPPGTILCERYAHGFTDREFFETARARGVWTASLDSHVEHCHPAWGRGEWDAGYDKSQDPQRAFSDAGILMSRRHLWEKALI